MSILPTAHIGRRSVVAPDQVLQDDAVHTDTEKDRRARARAGVAAVDALLEILEQRHLRSQKGRVGMLPQWQRGLEAGGLVVPLTVSSATTTILLHERLLDWQVELLNAAYPRRAMGARLEQDVLSGGFASQAWRRGAHRWYGACGQAALRSGRSTLGHLDAESRMVAPMPPAEAPRTGENLDGLTDREVSVLWVVAEGLTNAQVPGDCI
jgi:ATP/maltotriose-dependent transcriptional regulator MalT